MYGKVSLAKSPLTSQELIQSFWNQLGRGERCLLVTVAQQPLGNRKVKLEDVKGVGKTYVWFNSDFILTLQVFILSPAFTLLAAFSTLLLGYYRRGYRGYSCLRKWKNSFGKFCIEKYSPSKSFSLCKVSHIQRLHRILLTNL